MDLHVFPIPIPPPTSLSNKLTYEQYCMIIDLAIENGVDMQRYYGNR